MSIFVAVIFGLLQGVAEFLPISSSGHIVLLSKIFHIDVDILFFNILLHLATLLAVVIVMRKRIWEILKKPFSKKSMTILVSMIPTFILAFVFKFALEKSFNGGFLTVCFLISAVLLLLTDFIAKHKWNLKKEVNFKQAFLIGTMQGLAVFPGISRSGSTIAMGVFSGVSKEEATDFSFLISIPIILGSMGYEVLKMIKGGVGTLNSSLILPLVLGFITAFVSGYFAAKFMIKYISKIKLYWFSLYLVIIAIVAAII